MSGWNETIQGMFAEERAQREISNMATAKDRFEKFVRRCVNEYLGNGEGNTAKIKSKTKLSFVSNEDDSVGMAQGIGDLYRFTVTLEELRPVKTYGEFLALMQAKYASVFAVTSTPPQIRPSVNQVSQAFHDLHADVRRIMANGGIRNPAKAQEEIDAAHDKLRNKLQAWGIADKIDWDRED